MKKLVVILTIAAVATGALATSLWLDLRAEHRKADEIAASLTAAESKQLVQAAAPQPAPAAPAVAVAGSQPAAAPAGATSAPANQKAAAAKEKSPMQGMLAAMASLEDRDTTRAMMATMYPDIERELGITAQQKEKLFDLLADEEQDSMSLFTGAQDPREMQRKMVEAERSHEAKLSALLGNKYPNWEEYQSNTAARGQVDQLRSSLSAVGNPLSEAQSQQLITAFAVENRRANKEEQEWSRSPAAMKSPNMMQEAMQRAVSTQSRLVDVAAPILNPAQLDRYKKQAEMAAAAMRAGMSMFTGESKP